MNPNICNNCGGDYEYRNGRWICRSCGSYKPEEISNEEVTLLYTASQKLRLAEFDEAEQEFDDIVRKYPQNPHGYWGRLMSRYGIKYEEDFDGKRIPTCYATSIESVMEDRDYRKALEYADRETKEYYTRQVEYIERVRVEWVERARKEKPYDIFICYKDSDLANGISRTQDSIAAQDLYVHLTNKGYRVFYSHESLRDKAGEKYEPYIFSALSTAKVMLVYGSKPEYITSTWLKNEWTRYEKRIRAGEKRPNSLLVACDGFSPAELPRVLAARQCFDATQRSFYSDLDGVIAQILASDAAVPVSEGIQPVSTGHREKKNRKAAPIVVACAAVAVVAGVAVAALGMLGGRGQAETVAPPPVEEPMVTEAEVTREPTMTEEPETALTDTGVVEDTGEVTTVGTDPVMTEEVTTTEETTEEVTGSVGLEYSMDQSLNMYCVSGVGTALSYSPHIVIPETYGGVPVVGISDHAFENAGILSIRIPDSITYIGEFAFRNCTMLQEIAIPDSVESIGAYAFDECQALQSVSLPDDLWYISDYTFSRCGSLTEFTFPSGISQLGANVFHGSGHITSFIVDEENPSFCSVDGILYKRDTDGNAVELLMCPKGKTELTVPIPDTVTTIADDAFAGCRNLTEIHIPDGVIRIGRYAFSGCEGLSQVPDFGQVQIIEEWAFYGCSGLREITIPECVTIIKAGAFGHTGITKVHITKNVDSIALEAFPDCPDIEEFMVDEENPVYSAVNGVLCDKQATKLILFPAGKSDFVIPDSIRSIGPRAIQNCKNLSQIHIPEGVTEISENAIGFCENLSRIEIPGSVTEIGVGFAVFCPKLAEIRVDESNVHFCSLDGVLYRKDPMELIRCPANGYFNYIIPEGVTCIRENAFEGCSKMQQIVIPQSATDIYSAAFNGCSNLKNVYYGGTSSQWLDAYILHTDGNDFLAFVPIHYNYTP